MLLGPWLWLLGACFLQGDYPEPLCAERRAYYPDEDGDGIGEPTAVYVGCAPPAGWVLVVAAVRPSDPGDSAETGDSGDTGGP